ncbi:MAG: hypothetical protein IKX54_05230 [Lachnospiraceae bacterium]|nr:hypothetical protein [Lachnospiraceae bacterium]
MSMGKMPAVTTRANGGKVWSSDEFDTFSANVYVPDDGGLPSDVINYGFEAPYLIVLEERPRTAEEAAAWADESGLAGIAARYSGSVVFVTPKAADGWNGADETLFQELIANSKIHQYFEDGAVKMRNRFTGEAAGFFLRGAIFRTFLYGFGASADYIARCLLKTVNGEFLWGPGEITPAVCTLERLSSVPAPQRKDIPVVSIGNTNEVNRELSICCDNLLVRDRADYAWEFDTFVRRFRRWCGNLEQEPVLAEMGMIREECVEELPTSPDNCGDDKGTTVHKVGFVVYRNSNLFESGKPVPMLLAFHGGGDSAMYIANVSAWYRVANRYNFLLVAIENHLNSTATEMIALIDRLKSRYNIDEKRIYASGFSMGCCKSWDLFQEHPEVFAGLAPMDATFEVGLNSYGKPAQCEINRDKAVPTFYAGGAVTPLPELPFQAQKCVDRIRWLFGVNRVKKAYPMELADADSWENKIWGVNGDRTEVIADDSRQAKLTIEYFDSEDGVCRTALGSVDNQGHECRHHTCEQAWLFLSKFARE